MNTHCFQASDARAIRLACGVSLHLARIENRIGAEAPGFLGPSSPLPWCFPFSSEAELEEGTSNRRRSVMPDIKDPASRRRTQLELAKALKMIVSLCENPRPRTGRAPPLTDLSWQQSANSPVHRIFGSTKINYSGCKFSYSPGDSLCLVSEGVVT